MKTAAVAGAVFAAVFAGGVAQAETVFVQAMGNIPPHLNRLLTTDIAASQFAEMVMEPLVVQDAEYVPQPLLATSWEVNADSTEFTFHIRQGVKFHNGETMKASDVAFTLRTYLPLAPQTSLLKDYIQEITAPDDATVVVRLNQPFAPFVAALAGIPIVPESVFGDGQDVLTHPANMAPVGTGPFQLVTYDQGERVVLSRFDDYWGTPAAIDTMVLPIISDQNARLLAFEGGDLDFLYGSLVDKASYARMYEMPGVGGYEMGGGVNTLTVHLNARSGPLADVAVRRALYQAISSDMLSERAYYGYGTPARGPIPAAIAWAASPDVDFRTDLPYDPAAAAAALDAGGYPVGADGTRFTLRLAYISSFGVLAESSNVIKANLAEVGVNVDLIGEEFNTWADRSYLTHDFDMSIVFYTSYQDPSLGVARVYICNPDNVFFRNSSGICDEQIDADFARAGAVSDPAERQAAFADAERGVLGVMNAFPLVDDSSVHFGRTDRWDFSTSHLTSPANWSLVTPVAQ